jgi:hypothetical protein
MPKTKPTLELTVEFAIELLLVFIPYGADQMGIPHNFWVGLACWILGASIAIRMFWIFPWWSHRTSLEKGLILFILLAVITIICYQPVMTAYDHRNGKEEAKSAPVQPPVQTPAQPPVQPPTETTPPSQGTATPPSIEIPLTDPVVKPIPGARPLPEKGGTYINSFPTTVTYNCIGQKTISKSASDEQTSTSNEEVDSIIQMEKLNNSKNYAGLLELCGRKMKSAPSWQTPYLFCSLGYFSIGNTVKARELFDQYENYGGFDRNRIGYAAAPFGPYKGEPCKQLSDFLHSHL